MESCDNFMIASEDLGSADLLPAVSQGEGTIA